MTIRSGDLAERVGFYQRSALDDGYGNSENGFAVVFTAAAQIKPRLGGEGVLAGRLAGRNLVNITVRKFAATSEVTTDWMVKDERTLEEYNIRSIIDPDQDTSKRGSFLEMLCEKGAAI